MYHSFDGGCVVFHCWCVLGYVCFPVFVLYIVYDICCYEKASGTCHDNSVDVDIFAESIFTLVGHAA